MLGASHGGRSAARALLLCGLGVAMLMVCAPAPALAAGSTWYVTTPTDDASATAGNCSTTAPANPATAPPCSLRDAFAAAQPGDTISVDLPSADASTPLELTSGLALSGSAPYPTAVTLKLNGSTLEPDDGLTMQQYALTIDGAGQITAGPNVSDETLLDAQWGSTLTLSGALVVTGAPYDSSANQAPTVSVDDNGDSNYSNPQPGALNTSGGVEFVGSLPDNNDSISSNEGAISLGQTTFDAAGIYAQEGTLALGVGNTTVTFDDDDYELQGCDIYQFSSQYASYDTTVTTPGTVVDDSGTCLGASTSNPPLSTQVTLSNANGNQFIIGVGAPLTFDAVVCPEDPSAGSCPPSSNPAPPAGKVRFGVRPLDSNNEPEGVGQTLGTATLTPGPDISDPNESSSVSAEDGSLATFTHTFSAPGEFYASAGYIPASGASAPAAADAFSVSGESANLLSVVPEPDVTLSTSSGQAAAACQNAGTSDGNLVSGQCTDVTVATNEPNNPPNVTPGNQTLSLTYNDGTGTPQTQSAQLSGGGQTSSTDFGVTPDDHGGSLTGTFTGQDGVFGTSSVTSYVPGFAFATAKGSGASVCAGDPGDPGVSPVEGDCSDEQVTLSVPSGAPSFNSADQVVLTYAPADGGQTQTETKTGLKAGVIDFGVTPSATTGTLSAVFTSSSDAFLNFSTQVEFDASESLEPSVSTAVAKGASSTACQNANATAFTSSAEYMPGRCSEVDVTIKEDSGGPPLDGDGSHLDTVQVIPEDSSGAQQGTASPVMQIPPDEPSTPTRHSQAASSRTLPPPRSTSSTRAGTPPTTATTTRSSRSASRRPQRPT